VREMEREEEGDGEEEGDELTGFETLAPRRRRSWRIRGGGGGTLAHGEEPLGEEEAASARAGGTGGEGGAHGSVTDEAPPS